MSVQRNDTAQDDRGECESTLGSTRGGATRRVQASSARTAKGSGAAARRGEREDRGWKRSAPGESKSHRIKGHRKIRAKAAIQGQKRTEAALARAECGARCQSRAVCRDGAPAQQDSREEDQVVVDCLAGEDGDGGDREQETEGQAEGE